MIDFKKKLLAKKKEEFLKKFKVGDKITCQSWVGYYIEILSIGKDSFQGKDNNGGYEVPFAFNEEIWIPYTGEVTGSKNPIQSDEHVDTQMSDINAYDDMKKATVKFISATGKEIVMDLSIKEDGKINLNINLGECEDKDYKGLNMGLCNMVMDALNKKG